MTFIVVSSLRYSPVSGFCPFPPDNCDLRLSIGQASLPHCIRLASQLSGGKGQKPETGEYLNDETTMKVIEDAHKGVSTFENSGVS
jgi:hypothetical protein